MSKTALALQRYEIFLKQPNFTLSHVRFPPIVFSASLSQRKSNIFRLNAPNSRKSSCGHLVKVIWSFSIRECGYLLTIYK